MVIFCLICGIVGIYLFWKNVNQSYKKNAPPIGYVQYQYHEVERRFAERLIWGHVERGVPLYSGDLIRTGSLSDTTLNFLSGDSVSIFENTLIQIFYDERQGVRISHSSGELVANSAGGVLAIASHNKEVSVEAGGTVRVRGGGASFEAIAEKKNAVILSDGETHTIAEGRGVHFDADGIVTQHPFVSVEMPKPVETVLENNLPRKVLFRWTTNDIESDELIRLDAARNRALSTDLITRDFYGTTEAELDLDAGTWWWRLSRPNADEGAMEAGSGRITITADPPEGVGIAAVQELLQTVQTLETDEPPPVPVPVPVPVSPPKAPEAPAWSVIEYDAD
ncbi:MAG: hypothetical protein LBD20_04790 [Spirochaetaceae bacterium]|nr:hypothetical protein [Spirochaetaceae bacterium]